MGLKIRIFISIISLASIAMLGSCSYSFTGAATSAQTISVDQFFNNSDLAPPNLAASFTNNLKDYFQQNSSLKVVQDNADLAVEGVLSDYRLNPIAPTANNADPTNRINAAALTRLTIAVKVNYVDSKVPTNSFKDKTFSFYMDFDNNLNFQTVQEDLEKKIFEQIMLDIFNATVANW
jgi:Lipopolysaccharide-assembly